MQQCMRSQAGGGARSGRTRSSTPARPPMRGASSKLYCASTRATVVSCMMRPSDCPMHLHTRTRPGAQHMAPPTCRTTNGVR